MYTAGLVVCDCVLWLQLQNASRFRIVTYIKEGGRGQGGTKVVMCPNPYKTEVSGFSNHATGF